MATMAARSCRQGWSIAGALVVALLLVAAAGTLPDGAGAANEEPTETESKKSRISYSLMKATCPHIEGAEYYETNDTYGCRYGDGGSNDCDKKDEMCSYTPPGDDKKPSGKPAPADPRLEPVGGSGQFVDPALSDDGTLAADDALTTGTDVDNPARDAQVIPPATAVWTARGRTADDQTGTEPLRADGTGTVREGTTVSEPGDTVAPATAVWEARGRTTDDRAAAEPLRADGDGTIQETSTASEPGDTLAPDQSETAEAAISVNPEPVGNADFDKFKGDCEGQGGRVEQTGEFQWTCYLPSGLTTTCDLSPSPELYDCGEPQDSSLPGIGTHPMTTGEVLVVSEPVATADSGDEVSEQPAEVSDSENPQVASGSEVILLDVADEEEAADA